MFADLGEGGPGGIDADALLDGDLQDFAFLIAVHVLVVVGPQFDLIDEAFLDIFKRHDGLPPSWARGWFWASPPAVVSRCHGSAVAVNDVGLFARNALSFEHFLGDYTGVSLPPSI